MVQELTRHDGQIGAATDWNTLRERIETRQAVVGIIGLGYVGLPLAMGFLGGGFRVIGFDVNPAKIDRLAAGESDILDVPTDRVAEGIAQQTFHVSMEPDVLGEADAVIICVPTPCHRNRQPDLSMIQNAAITLCGALRPGQLIILESTTYPGTTEEMLVPLLSTSGLRVQDDFLVAFSPERIDPGNANYDVTNTPKVVGGLGETAGELACALYTAVIPRVVRVKSPREAEMAKLIENTFRHINIALVNELALIAGKIGVDIWEAIDAAATKPFGFMPFYPGPGVGGHCIPIDPHYLSWKAREMGCEIEFIELAERINHHMPEHVVRMTVDALNARGLSVRGARVLILGLAYKRDIDDIRESPSLPIIDRLLDYGAQVLYHDPHIPTFTYRNLSPASCPLSAELLHSMDCVVLVTDHRTYDRELLRREAPVIIDTRNVFKGDGENVVRL